jgi:hypothetical protein
MAARWRTPTTIPMPTCRAEMPALLYHYTSASLSKFISGLDSGTSATHDPSLNADEAIAFLGVSTRPNKIVVVKSTGFIPNRPFIVDPHKRGPGGGTDFFNERRVAAIDIVEIIPLPGEPP